jgi:Asp-tRNA(Asn)/Glu-tRNA(Gln) amidotransferase A subunit family amidase
MRNLTFSPAHQLASLIRDRSISAVELLNEHLAEMELLAIAQQLDAIIGDLHHPPAYSESPQDSKKITDVSG